MTSINSDIPDERNNMGAYSALKWLVNMGATDATSDQAQNHFEMAAPAKQQVSGQSLKQTMQKGPAPIQPKAPRSALGNSPHEATRAVSGANSLEELYAIIHSFDGGHVKRTANHTVFADGQRHADLMIIGDAPSKEDDKSGRPFSGPEGTLLERMLQAISLDRQQDVYLTQLVPWRALGQKVPDAHTVAMCLPFLRKHIALQKPKIILCLGASPAQALFGNEVGISRLRGKWIEIEIEKHTCSVLATYHPSTLLTQPRFKGHAWRDLQMMKERLFNAI